MKFTATKENVRIIGRTLTKDGVLYLGYSGSNIAFTFKGRKAVASILSDPERFDDTLKGRIAVYVGEEEQPSQRICLDEAKKEIVLFESGEEQEVTITIQKYSEAPFGTCGIEWIEIDTDELMAPPAHKERKIEIVGDSITCGYGVEAASEAITFHTETENPTKSYSLLTAKACNAEAQLVSWSGNGIISHYVEENVTERRIEVGLMPKIYQFTDLSGSARLFGGSEETWEKWDFSRFVPQLIIVNLGTNDASWCKDIQERRNHYRDEYVNFLTFIREKNPQAEILCTLGTMDQRLVPTLGDAVKLYAEKSGDGNVHYLALPMQNAADGYGADWHPCPYSQKVASELVAAEVKKIMNWD